MSKCKKFQICLLILHILVHGRSLQLVTPENWPNSSIARPYIIGGTNASLNQIFFLVSICLRHGLFTSTYGHICGGSLITQRAVISAAHCSDLKYYNLVMGILRRSQETKHTLRFRVNTIIAHADYNRQNFANDIVIFFAKGRVPRNHFVHPIKLPEYEAEPSSTCKVYGWGVLKSLLSDIAQEAKVELYSRSDCIAAYSQPGYRITNGMICAGNRKGGVDACLGDSGGPLTYDDVLIGIVSFGVDCGLPQYPGVYTNVFYYKEWINETLRNSSKSRTHYILFILLITEMLKFVT